MRSIDITFWAHVQVVGETAKIHLTQKGGKLAITCKVVTNSTTDEGAEPQQTVAEYVAHIDVAEVPEDTELRTEVVANRVGEDVEATEAAPSAFALQLKVRPPYCHTAVTGWM